MREEGADNKARQRYKQTGFGSANSSELGGKGANGVDRCHGTSRILPRDHLSVRGLAVEGVGGGGGDEHQ